MAKTIGILEPEFADAMARASNIDLALSVRNLGQEFPADFPRTEAEVVQKAREVYRANQAVVDAAVEGAVALLTSAEGKAHVDAFAAATPGGMMTDLGYWIADRMLQADQFSALRANLASPTELATTPAPETTDTTSSAPTASSPAFVTYGLGVSAELFYYIGIGGGGEALFGYARDGRMWLDLELQYKSLGSGGLSLSFWTNAPENSIIFGIGIDLGKQFANVLGVVRFMLIFQYIPVKHFNFGGFSLQIGVGLLEPKLFAAGIFAGVQRVFRSTRVKLKVRNTATNTNNIQAAVTSTLAVTITSEVVLKFDAGATMRLTPPTYFTTDDLAAMTISPPDGWSLTTDNNDFVFTADSAIEWSEGQQIKFDIDNVESAGSATGITDGFFKLTAHPDTKIPVAATQNFDLVWEIFSASITWEATSGSSPYQLTLGGVCTGESTCKSTSATTVYSANSLEPNEIISATDSDSNTWWLAYQFNYTSSGTDGYTAQLRAVIWNPNESDTVIPYNGGWVDVGYNSSTVAQYHNNSSGATLTITVSWP
jgi:hypothetical protein